MMYTYANNDQPFKGDDSPLIGLLDVAGHEQRGELAHAGRHARARSPDSRRVRRKSTTRTSTSTRTRSTRRRTASSRTPGFTLTPFSWGYLKTNIGTDAYTNQNLMLRHPESAMCGIRPNGILDINDDITRNINAQTVFNVNDHRARQGSVASAARRKRDSRSQVDGRRRRRAPTSSIRTSSRSTTR